MTPGEAGLALVEGRRIMLDAALIPLVTAGVLAVDGFSVGSDASLTAALADRFAKLRDEFAGRAPSGIRALDEARRLYRAAGVDPTRNRPSSEALVRRACKGLTPPQVNNAVDACNLASVSFMLPIGLYDRDAIAGDVAIRLGREGEEYPGIRKGPVHLGGRLGLFDARGPFGSPTSDSLRTSVSEMTRRLLAVVFATAACDRATMLGHLELFAGLLLRHGGGSVTTRAVLPAAEG